MAGTSGISFTSARHYHAGYPAKTRPAAAPLDETAVTPLKAHSSNATESKGVGTYSSPIEPLLTSPAASATRRRASTPHDRDRGDTSGLRPATMAIYQHLMQHEASYPSASMDAFEETIRKTIGPLRQADGVANLDQCSTSSCIRPWNS
ncbi:MAG: hypothetical protein R3B49_02820 [Phycisphaerales bacterium]